MGIDTYARYSVSKNRFAYRKRDVVACELLRFFWIVKGRHGEVSRNNWYRYTLPF